jgi:hypothetical protein
VPQGAARAPDLLECRLLGLVAVRAATKEVLSSVCKVWIKREEPREVALIPFGMYAVEEQAFRGAQRIDHNPLPDGEIGSLQFTKGIGPSLPHIALECFVIRKSCVLRCWLVYSLAPLRQT